MTIMQVIALALVMAACAAILFIYDEDGPI